MIAEPAARIAGGTTWVSGNDGAVGLRTALMTGPGPEGGGSKNNISRPHWPERSGIGEPPSAAIAGKRSAAVERTIAIVLPENGRGERIRIPDINPSILDRSFYTASNQ